MELTIDKTKDKSMCIFVKLMKTCNTQGVKTVNNEKLNGYCLRM